LTGDELMGMRMNDMPEQRRSPRFDVVLKVRYETREDFQEALLHSLSQVGLYLATDAPFDVGYQFGIEIILPESRGTIEGKCRVVWVNQIEVKHYPKGMGVEFIEMDTESKSRLEEYLGEIASA
jgi:uncharacterized protein (TIGR02266 family)